MTVRLALGQISELDSETAQLALQLGLRSVQFNTPRIPAGSGVWETADLMALRDDCERIGLSLEALENVPAHFLDRVVLGLDGWQAQLERYCTTIEHVGAAGIPVLGYHFMGLGVWRTSMKWPAQGGATVSAFDAKEIPNGNDAASTAHPVDVRRSSEEMWINYARFLAAVLPVAERSGVKLALHPDDPPVEEIEGVARIFTSPGALARAYELSEGSAAWGLDLCLGTTSSMEGGARAVTEAIDFFGPRERIFYVHFRDVQGTVPKFQECFLGDGNYDPFAVMQKLLDCGFDGFILDDHVPRLVGDTPYGHRARAHALGYIQATLTAAQKISGFDPTDRERVRRLRGATG